MLSLAVPGQQSHVPASLSDDWRRRRLRQSADPSSSCCNSSYFSSSPSPSSPSSPSSSRTLLEPAAPRILPKCQQQSSFYWGCQARGNLGGASADTQNMKNTLPRHCHSRLQACLNSGKFYACVRDISLGVLKISGVSFSNLVHVDTGLPNHTSSMLKDAKYVSSAVRYGVGVPVQTGKIEEDLNKIQDKFYRGSAPSGSAGCSSVSSEKIQTCQGNGSAVLVVSAIDEDDEDEEFFDCVEEMPAGWGLEERGAVSFLGLLGSEQEGSEQDKGSDTASVGKESVSEVSCLVGPQGSINNSDAAALISHPDGGVMHCPECEETRRSAQKILSWVAWIGRLLNMIGLISALIGFLVQFIKWVISLIK